MDAYKGFIKFCIVLMALFILVSFLDSNAFTRMRFNIGYSRAWSLLKKEKYSEASRVSHKLDYLEYHGFKKQIPRSQFVVILSSAGMYCSEENYKFAYSDMCKASRMISDGKVSLTDRQQAIYDGMWDKIESLYLDHKAEYDAHDKEIDELFDEYKKKYGDSMSDTFNSEPYVGMSYIYIDNTILGKHADVEFGYSSTTIDGIKYSTDVYYWKDGEKTIYSATVANMKVISVHDYRPKSSTSGSDSNSSSSGSSSSKKSTQKTTEFDPDDHDIDQYYEDFKDEEGFEDIDDAYDDFEDNPEYWDDY